MLDNYYDERLKLFPLEATAIGDARYNNLLPVDFSDAYRDTLNEFYSRYQAYLTKHDREYLNAKDRLSYDVFKREMEINLEGLKFHDNYMPFNQFNGLTLTMGQLGSGDGNQPFKTVKDYDDWISRALKFSAWADSAIVYFRKGIATDYVLPRALVIKMLPQMEAMQVKVDTVSLFYNPIKKLPPGFSSNDKKRLTSTFLNLIHNQIIPSYKRLGDFLKNEYLPKARTTSGVGALADGKAYYQYCIRLQTTTNKSPEEIYRTGLNEVARIRRLQDSIKNEVGFKDDLQSFFNFMKTDKQFTPYKSPEEIINAFKGIHERLRP